MIALTDASRCCEKKHWYSSDFLRRPQKFEKIFPYDLMFTKFKLIWIFRQMLVAFLENLNFMKKPNSQPNKLCFCVLHDSVLCENWNPHNLHKTRKRVKWDRNRTETGPKPDRIRTETGSKQNQKRTDSK